jgi:hypothetical protein
MAGKNDQRRNDISAREYYQDFQEYYEYESFEEDLDLLRDEWDEEWAARNCPSPEESGSKENGRKGGGSGIGTFERRQNYIFMGFEQLQKDVSDGFIDEGFAAFILDDFGVSTRDRNRILLAWKSRIEEHDGKVSIFIGNRLEGKDISELYLYPDKEGKIYPSIVRLDTIDAKIPKPNMLDSKIIKKSIIDEYTNVFGTGYFHEIIKQIEIIKKTEVNIPKNATKPTFWWAGTT